MIVGAGFTGLWTAYYLAKADPSLRIVVLEAETVGYGASGRNGGWCSALFPASARKLAAMSSRPAAIEMHRAMQASVNEVGLVSAAEGIDCDYHKGGTIVLARSAAQLARARAEVAEAHEWGPGDLRFLEPDEVETKVRATKVLGATFTPHCAVIHPGKLVRGLATVVERLGVTIYEQTPVRTIESRPARAVTAYGTVRAEVVVRATEGFTPGLAGEGRTVAPVYSLVVATEPLDDATWDRIGLADRPSFSDHRHLIIYGQRTADGRLVFGGRGAPYHFRSRVRSAYDEEPRVFRKLQATLRDLFDLRDVRFTHAWGGALGVPRDWCASVGLSDGVAWAGGYVGDGVSTTNLAGRTLTDLILRRDTNLTRLPWVGHQSRRWEPEPFRWLGINAGLHAMTLADAEERLTRHNSQIARLMAPLLGH